jgi:hypothetical protein
VTQALAGVITAFTGIPRLQAPSMAAEPKLKSESVAS